MTKEQVLQTLSPAEKEIFYIIDGVSHSSILTYQWMGNVAKALVQNPPVTSHELLKEGDVLDNTGEFKKSDCVRNVVVAVNNYMQTKKQRSPVKDLSNKIDMMNSQISDMKNNMDNSDPGSSDTEVTLDDQQVEFKEKN